MSRGSDTLIVFPKDSTSRSKSVSAEDLSDTSVNLTPKGNSSQNTNILRMNLTTIDTAITKFAKNHTRKISELSSEDFQIIGSINEAVQGPQGDTVMDMIIRSFQNIDLIPGTIGAQIAGCILSDANENCNSLCAGSIPSRATGFRPCEHNVMHYTDGRLLLHSKVNGSDTGIIHILDLDFHGFTSREVKSIIDEGIKSVSYRQGYSIASEFIKPEDLPRKALGTPARVPRIAANSKEDNNNRSHGSSSSIHNHNNNNKNNNKNNNHPPTPPNHSQSKHHNFWFWIIVILFVILIIALIVFAVRRSRAAKACAPVCPPPTPPCEVPAPPCPAPAPVCHQPKTIILKDIPVIKNEPECKTTYNQPMVYNTPTVNLRVSDSICDAVM